MQRLIFKIQIGDFLESDADSAAESAVTSIEAVETTSIEAVEASIEAVKATVETTESTVESTKATAAKGSVADGNSATTTAVALSTGFIGRQKT